MDIGCIAISQLSGYNGYHNLMDICCIAISQLSVIIIKSDRSDHLSSVMLITKVPLNYGKEQVM